VECGRRVSSQRNLSHQWQFILGFHKLERFEHSSSVHQYDIMDTYKLQYLVPIIFRKQFDFFGLHHER
jgi:hypothetical protein